MLNEQENQSNGSTIIFNPEEISLADINALIDIGKRFNIKPGLKSSEYTNIKKYLGEDIHD